MEGGVLTEGPPLHFARAKGRAASLVRPARPPHFPWPRAASRRPPLDGRRARPAPCPGLTDSACLRAAAPPAAGAAREHKNPGEPAQVERHDEKNMERKKWGKLHPSPPINEQLIAQNHRAMGVEMGDAALGVISDSPPRKHRHRGARVIRDVASECSLLSLPP